MKRRTGAAMSREEAFRRIRMASIESVIKDRHGPRGCDTDDGEQYLWLVVQTFAAGFQPEDADRLWTSTVGPWVRRMLPVLNEAVARDFLNEALDRPQRFKGPKAGKLLNVTDDERVRLSLRTLGSTSDSVARHRARDRQRAERKRRQAGAVPREMYQARSAASVAASCGVSRKTLWKWRTQGRDFLRVQLRQHLAESIPDEIVDEITAALVDRKSARPSTP